MKNCILFLMLAFTLPSIAQDREWVRIDSMKRMMVGMKDDTNKVKILKSISSEYPGVHPDSGIFWGEKALKLARDIGWRLGEAHSLHSLAINYKEKKDTGKALSYFRLTLKILDEIDPANEKRKIPIISNIGTTYVRIGDYAKALEYFFIALEKARKLDSKFELARRMYFIAETYQRQHRNQEALEWYAKSLEILEQIDNKDEATYGVYLRTCFNTGGIYNSQGNVVKALEWFQRAQKIAEQTGDQKTVRMCLTNMAGIYMDNGDLSKSLELYLKFLKMSEQRGDLSGVAWSCADISLIYLRQGDTAKQRDWAFKALKIAEQAGDDRMVASSCSQIGDYYGAQNPPDKKTALKWYVKGLHIAEKISDWRWVTLSCTNVGSSYCGLKSYDSARFYHLKALAISKAFEPGNEAYALRGLGNVFLAQADDSELHLSQANKCALLDSAVFYLQASVQQLSQQGSAMDVSYAMNDLSRAYYLRSDHAQALEGFKAYRQYMDATYNEEQDQKFAAVETRYAIQKAQDSIKLEEDSHKLDLDNAAQIEIRQRENERQQSAATRIKDQQQLLFKEALKKQSLEDSLKLQAGAVKQENDRKVQLAAAAEERRVSNARANLQRQQTSLTVSIGGAVLFLLVGLLSFRAYQERSFANLAIGREQEKNEILLQNILPAGVALELKEQGHVVARIFDETSVLFTDFVDFTATSQVLSPKAIVKELHECFSAFDAIIRRNGLEKIKSIGDIYMAVCGLPQSDPKHAQHCVNAALEILDFMQARSRREKVFKIRIGINSGPVLAGVVGLRKFAYDIWGDTVNIAARMEQHGEANAINISESTYKLVKADFRCSYRGEVAAKNKGEIAMYFVEGKAGKI